MRVLPIVLVAGLLAPALALGAEPSGCGKFKWPMTHEQAALAAAPSARLESGAALAFDTAAQLRLAPFAQANLDMPPQRAPKLTPSYAGSVKLGAPTTAATVKISISAEGWIDVVQNGHYVKPTGFSGATDCPGLRKSVKFPLAAAPATIQLSNVSAPDISLIVSPE